MVDHGAVNTGYWGEITSSVDWCEENYVYSNYIAEFWNTVSSFAMVLFGLFGMAFHHRSVGWRMTIAYALVVVVGIGSILFHATLQYSHQMWDEVPMVWTASYLLWIMLREHGYTHPLYGAVIALYCAFATLATSYFNGPTQFFIFQFSFGLVMWSSLWFVWKLYKGAKDAEAKKLFERGAVFLVTAISVWLIDSNFCSMYTVLPNPQLHAWWHVLICTSLHFLFSGCGYMCLVNEGRKPKVFYVARWVPYVDFDKSKAK